MSYRLEPCTPDIGPHSSSNFSLLPIYRLLETVGSCNRFVLVTVWVFTPAGKDNKSSVVGIHFNQKARIIVRRGDLRH
jgi:hypothetical protein